MNQNMEQVSMVVSQQAVLLRKRPVFILDEKNKG